MNTDTVNTLDQKQTPPNIMQEPPNIIISTKVSIVIDSNSRFSKKNRLYTKLPSDKYGWNRFAGYVKNGYICYKGRRVICINDIKHCYQDMLIDEESDKPYYWYYFFVYYISWLCFDSTGR